MQIYRIPIWKTSPFCRLIIPLIAGIILQWYGQYPIGLLLMLAGCFAVAFFLFYTFPLSLKFRLQFLQGILLFFLLGSFAMLLTWQKDIRHHNDWYGHHYIDSSRLIVRIDEPVVERTRSYKVTGYVEDVVNDTTIVSTKGKLFIYFSKDSIVDRLHYGDKILINKPLQPIKNSGNPGAFNYERYAAFQQTFHTVYLKPGEWILLPAKNVNPLQQFIFYLQANVINILQNYVDGSKDVVGIAEALLIGYKEDLDKDLVQAYSNAGVVHIIAISGLHLGLIYVLLVWIFNRLPVIKNQKLLKVIFILSCLWLFSLLTGASASVLRSAVMFTCIVIGKNFFKQSSIYNSLAASAFLLLVFDPYFLWDVGFQLSYLAVIGIVALQKPIIDIFYSKKTWINKLWNMMAITLAAQLITCPVCIYYFHQFPNLFFITNLLAVPLSTAILFAEIFLIAFSWVPFLNVWTGKLTGALVWLMNMIISTCNKIPYSLWDNIYSDIITTWLLYGIVTFSCAWLIHKHTIYFRAALISLLGFTTCQMLAKLRVHEQKKIVIYNVPQKQAIDLIYQDSYYFKGDSSMVKDGLLRNFHLKPARIALQTVRQAVSFPGLFHVGMEWQFFDKKMIIIDSAVHFLPAEKKIEVNILLISKNPSIKIEELLSSIRPAIVVFDASNSLWKIAGWKKACERLALPCFSIPEKGAFILDIE